MAQQYSAKVVAQVGSAGGHGGTPGGRPGSLTLQGSEAGGHGREELGNGIAILAARLESRLAARRRIGTFQLTLGIVDGRGVAAVLALGCDGAVLNATLLRSSKLGPDASKQRLVAAALA
jgi:nitronate monooxygenase